MPFSQKTINVPGQLLSFQIPMLERRTGRDGLVVQVLGGNVLNGLSQNFWHLSRRDYGDLLDSEFLLGASSLNSPGFVGYWMLTLCPGNQTQSTVNANIIYDGIQLLLSEGFTAFEFFLEPTSFPWSILVWESWPDKIKAPICSDGQEAQLLVDQFTNKVSWSNCKKPKPLPIISIDATVQRLKKRGLLNV